MEDMDDMEARYEVFFQLAESYDDYEAVRAARHKAPSPGGTPSVPGNRPGDDYNRRASWAEILEPHGWVSVGGSGEKTYWRRPGKTGNCWSATTGYCRTDLRGDLLYVFSTSAAPFDAEAAYSKFEAYALLEHNGDFGAAARRLAERGYGGQEPPRLISSGKAEPAGELPPSAETSADPLDQDATAADLIAANATIRWAWEGWIPLGVLTILASEPGIGKTRLCADLLRRVHAGLPWPDGSPPTFPAGSPGLWVPADNQHAELGSLPAAFGFPPDVLYLNATRRNPFRGTMLDTAEDLADFEARVARVRPALVFIDTILNATDRTSHRPEDAKALFVPLQQMAARLGAAVLCVTHLNASGKPLGRRIEGQGRVVLMLERPDPEGQPFRRKLYVRKSNSLYPPALGVTMGTAGNDYDTNPPTAPDDEAPRLLRPRLAPAGDASAGTDCRDWLAHYLSSGPRRVGDIRARGQAEGFSGGAVYRARDEVGVEEYEEGGRKWWRLPTLEPENEGANTP